ncbi:MAG: ABC transporter substrate-binding protein [Peptococcaceae bacterium]|jgi:peptide/nickel transport system substrate-binding protein|nr:ABC transporter substrate-binding protein [Peptococcaceae bacterium]
MAKRLTAFISIVLILGLLAGCGSGSGNAGQGNTGTGNTGSGNTSQGNTGTGNTNQGNTGTTTPPPPARSKTVNIGSDVKATTLDPHNFRDSSSQYIIAMCFESLIYTNHDGKGYDPMLAERWDIAEDGKSWTFYLRKGVKFNDGKDFDADDVVYTVDRIMSHKDDFAWLPQYLPTLESADKIDQYTVRVNLSGPTPLAGNGFRCMYIIPNESMEKYGDDMFFGQPPKMVATGPWRMKEWVDGQYISYTKNELYWDIAQHDSYFDEVYIHYIAEPTSAIAAHLTGTMDTYIRLSGISEDLIPLYAGTENRISVVPYGTNSTTWLGLSFKEGSIWNDEKVRKAFDMCIDRQLIIDNILGGTASLPLGYFHSSVIGHNAALGNPEFNTEKAKQLLAESSYNGEAFALMAGVANSETEGIFLTIADMANSIGFNMSVQFEDLSVFTPRQNSGDYDFFTVSTSIPDGIPQRMLNRIPQNFDKADFVNPEMNDLINKFLTDLDANKRAEYAKQVNDMIFELKAPHISLFHRDFKQALNWGIVGIRLFPDGMYDFAFVDYDPSQVK